MFKYKLNAALAAFLFSPILIAGDSNYYTLSQLYAFAPLHPSVKYSESEKNVAAYDRDAAKWAYFPSLTIDGSKPFDSSSSVTATLEQPLFTAGKITSVVNKADRALDAATTQIAVSEQQVKIEIATSFVEFIRARDRVLDSEDNIRALEYLYSIMQRRVEQEVSARAEKTLVYARVQQAISDRHQFVGLMSMAQNRLKSATGVDVKNVKKVECRMPDSLSEKILVDKAYLNSPELRKIQFERQSAQADVDAAIAERWPKIVIGAEQSYQGNDFSSSDLRGYLGIRFQLQDGLSINSRISSAEAKLFSIDENERVTKEQLRTEVAGYLRDYLAATNQLQPIEDLVQSNSDLIESYLRQYRAGKKSWLDVVNAQRELVQSKYLLIDTEATMCSSVARLELLTGIAMNVAL